MTKRTANQVKEAKPPEYRADNPQQAWENFQVIAKKALTTPKESKTEPAPSSCLHSESHKTDRAG